MPDHEELKHELDELKNLIKSSYKSDSSITEAVDKSNKYVNLVRGVIVVIGIFLVTGITWGITTTKMNVMNTQLEELKVITEKDIDRLIEDVHALQLKQAGDDQLLTTMQETLNEVRDDVKKLTGHTQ